MLNGKKIHRGRSRSFSSSKLALIKKEASVDGTRDCQVISHSRNLMGCISSRPNESRAMIKKDEKCLEAIKMCCARVQGEGEWIMGTKKDKSRRWEMNKVLFALINGFSRAHSIFRILQEIKCALLAQPSRIACNSRLISSASHTHTWRQRWFSSDAV